ncbi:MBL fold metallo-hydrolase [bacterium]|nr:MBL fold metallo-hydrolase [bacterium]
MKISIIASGSKGNCTIVSDGQCSILIDAGVSASRIVNALSELELDVSTLKALIVTHEHTDHIRGIGPLTRRTGIPVFCTQETWARSKNIIGTIDKVFHIESGISFQIEHITIHPFSIPHDAEDPIGLTLEANGRKVGLATDMGYATQLIKQKLKDCQALLLEFNYNRDMLISGPYTWPIKQRIMSKKGHLSNDDACSLLEEIIHDDLQHLVLAHISENNNLPELALLSAQDLCNQCGHRDVHLTVGNPYKHSPWLYLK